MVVMFVNVTGANIGATTSDKIIIPRVGDKIECGVVPVPTVDSVLFSFKKNRIIISINTISMISVC